MILIPHLLLQLVFFLGLAFGGFFIFQNTHRVDIFLGQNIFEAVPVWLCLLIAFLLGFIVAVGFAFNIKKYKKRG